ncbi:hypothetical protein EYS14_14755 [Alteromonadaceae bacterium M269]|nr:hypothetical protein EYS14_14755 [Alteromonadaceae bacterium M269]
MNDKVIDKLLYCSFCGKSQMEVNQLIAGPSVFSCNECTEKMVEIILSKSGDEQAKSFVKRINENERLKEINFSDGMDTVYREISFPPEYRHAGITILNNFSSLVRDKYSEENVKILIQQEHNKVVLIIESEQGELKERIEETLHTYGLVLSGEVPIDSLTDDPIKIAELNQQLRIARLQLENQKELLSIEQKHNRQLENKSASIEKQYKEMMSLLSDSMKTKDDENTFLRMLVEMSASCQSDIASKSLNSLIHIIETKTEDKGDEVIENMQKLHVDAPDIYERIRNFSESSIAGVTGNSIYAWVLSIINAIPK